MTEPADRAVLLLEKVSELLVESRAIGKELEVVPDGESSADTADRIAYGILVAALEEGLVNTIRHALDVLKRFRPPAGMLGEQWLREQETRLLDAGERLGVRQDFANGARATRTSPVQKSQPDQHGRGKYAR